MKLMMTFSLVIFLAGTAYVGWRIWQMIPLPVWGKALATVIFASGLATLVFNFVHGLDIVPMALAKTLYAFGTSWIFVLLYLFMAFLLMDVGRLCRVVPHSLLTDSWIGCALLTGAMVLVFGYGNLHYYNKVRVPLTLQTNKALERPLRMVMVSDLHLGYHNPRKELGRWVDFINAEHPDMVLIAGDIIDVSVRPLLDEDMAQEIRRIQAPIYACLGNHEYYSGEPRARQFFDDAGIVLLSDSVATVQGITVIGRDDRTNPARKSVDALMAMADTSKYTILLDHQPYRLEKAEQAGVDFQFSGHTHHGQVWPISWITDAIYECAFGPYQRGRTQYYISSGLGIWGGKFRIGTQSEYIVAELTNNHQSSTNK